jgi:RimJ/RimL family protein N-acetyltransferase
MQLRCGWPAPEAVQTHRLTLEPLRVEHADEMVAILQDPSLYTYTGGRAPDREELRLRYARQCCGHSPDGMQGWLNWIIREGNQRTAVGAVQATLRCEPTGLLAELAWVIGTRYQGRGYATEAARAMKRWLTACGVDGFAAYISRDHQASAGVARHLGLRATDQAREGELRWATTSRETPLS